METTALLHARRGRLALPGAVALLLAACNPTPLPTNDAAPGGDASNDAATIPGADAASDGAATGGPCNELRLDGVAPALVTYVDGVAPVAAGGTVRDGRYVLTRLTAYNLPAAQHALMSAPPAMLEVAGNVLFTATTDLSGRVGRTRETFHATGTTFSRHIECPSESETSDVGFTASDSQLEWIQASSTFTSVMTFTRQP